MKTWIFIYFNVVRCRPFYEKICQIMNVLQLETKKTVPPTGGAAVA